MQDHAPNAAGNIWPDEMADGRLPSPAARAWQGDLFRLSRDDALVLRTPRGDHARTIWLLTIALVASFALGWAGGLHWPRLEMMAGLHAAAAEEVSSRRTSDVKPAPKTEGVRKASGAASQSAQAPGATSMAVASIAARSRVAHLSSDSPSIVSSISEPTANPPDIAAAIKPLLAPAPETRPTTIPGWTVLDVRGGTAVLEGPDGIRMATRGDTVPGIGRVDSIVRWGNRWIVATANGLIAPP